MVSLAQPAGRNLWAFCAMLPAYGRSSGSSGNRTTVLREMCPVLLPEAVGGIRRASCRRCHPRRTRIPYPPSLRWIPGIRSGNHPQPPAERPPAPPSSHDGAVNVLFLTAFVGLVLVALFVLLYFQQASTSSADALLPLREEALPSVSVSGPPDSQTSGESLSGPRGIRPEKACPPTL